METQTHRPCCVRPLALVEKPYLRNLAFLAIFEESPVARTRSMLGVRPFACASYSVAKRGRRSRSRAIMAGENKENRYLRLRGRIRKRHVSVVGVGKGAHQIICFRPERWPLPSLLVRPLVQQPCMAPLRWLSFAACSGRAYLLGAHGLLVISDFQTSLSLHRFFLRLAVTMLLAVGCVAKSLRTSFVASS